MRDVDLPQKGGITTVLVEVRFLASASKSRLYRTYNNLPANCLFAVVVLSPFLPVRTTIAVYRIFVI